MDTRAAILAAVLARPDDDTPRLAYADWLDDHAADLPGPDAVRAHAEFIRLQIALARLPYVPCPDAVATECLAYATGAGCPVCGSRAPLRDRARNILREYDWHLWPAEVEGESALAGGGAADRSAERPWVAQVGDHDLGRLDRRVWYARGFAEEVALPAARWAATGAAVLSAHPVRLVRLADRPDLDAGPFAGGRPTPDAGDGAYTFPLWPGVRFTVPPPGPAPEAPVRPVNYVLVPSQL